VAVKDKDTAKEPSVTRIKASDAQKPAKKAQTKADAGQPPRQRRLDPLAPIGFMIRILGGIGGYFKGAWVELRQVRWPNRRATWGMTGALLGFTAFFIVFILLIDALFQYLFKLMLG
jgi:preprotein translocase SecE subunit